MALYPLLFDPIYKEKVWGGRTLERLGRTLPGGPDTLIGESWELADLDATSPSGGGGGGAYSRVRNGPLRERTVRDVLADFGPLVMGEASPTSDGAFPLLLKYLDARQNLSVQVHPSPVYAAAHPGAHLKSEAWYIVASDPGAVIYKGVRAGADRDDFRAAIADGSVADLLVAVPARPGDCHYLPSGTVHALGGGILVAEVQTASDTTFRVFDWERTGRELHVEQALECIDYGPFDASACEPRTPIDVEGRAGAPGATGRHLVECEHFSLTHWRLGARAARALVADVAVAIMVLEGSGELNWGEADQTVPVVGGDTFLVPAALNGAELASEEGISLLEVVLPAG